MPKKIYCEETETGWKCTIHEEAGVKEVTGEEAEKLARELMSRMEQAKTEIEKVRREIEETEKRIKEEIEKTLESIKQMISTL